MCGMCFIFYRTYLWKDKTNHPLHKRQQIPIRIYRNRFYPPEVTQLWDFPFIFIFPATIQRNWSIKLFVKHKFLLTCEHFQSVSVRVHMCFTRWKTYCTQFHIITTVENFLNYENFGRALAICRKMNWANLQNIIRVRRRYMSVLKQNWTEQ